jgi:hypothetical protein
VALSSACSRHFDGAELQRLVERHTQARGGARAIEAIRSIQFDLDIEEPTFKVRGYYIATRDGRMRIDVFADGKRVYTEAFDGRRGWELGQDAQHAKPSSAQGTAALKHGIEFPAKLFGLHVHEWRARGATLELAGHETVEAVSYPDLKLTLADGYQVRFLIDPVTSLIAYDRQRKAEHVDIDPTERWIQTSHEDYRSVAGVLFPFRQVERDLATGRELSRVNLIAVHVNPKIDPKMFDMPAG